MWLTLVLGIDALPAQKFQESADPTPAVMRQYVFKMILAKVT